MQTIPPALTARAMGDIPIAIGTSNAIEGLLGTNPNVEYPIGNKTPYKNYGTLAINIRTLARNIENSINPQVIEMLNGTILLEMVIEEINIINNYLSEHVGKRLGVVFYAGLYQKYETRFPEANIKVPKTPKQIEQAQRETDLFKLLTDNRIKKDIAPRLEGIKIDIEKYKPATPLFSRIIGSVVFLTHLPLDLLMTSVRRYALLESHTGKIKLPHELNTKLTGKPENIPFNLMSIQVYGDNGNMFSPKQKAVRNEVERLASQFRWHSMTGKDKVVRDCNNSTDPAFRQMANTMFRSG